MAFRDAIEGGWKAVSKLELLEFRAVEWAVETAKALANGSPLNANEDSLRIEALGLIGTGDLLCEELLWSADLKSGQRRNYMEQQAAYANGYYDPKLEE